MNSHRPRGTAGSKLAALWGSVSLLALAGAIPALAQGEVVAQAEEIPETVLITGSLIRGTAAVGVPVTNLSPRDFAVVGALTTADLFRTFPAANVSPGAPGTSAGNFVSRGARVNLRGLDTGDGTRSLLMVDGMRYPAQGQGLCMIDPSIIPQLALDHIDILVDGASATYGSDAIGGVINLILKRNMDGATTQFRWGTSEGGKNRYLASGIWGRTWDGGQVTLTYEWYNETPVMGDTHSNFTADFRPWGFDNRNWLGSAAPGIIATGPARQPGGGNVGTSAALGHGCTNCYAVPLGTGQNWNPGASGIGPMAPFSGSTLDWSSFSDAGNSGTNGLRNQFNAYDLSWYEPNQDRNAAVLTVDQRLTRNISFYGSAFYSNRRATMWNPGAITPTANAIIQGVTVPTFNPYYPAGGPTGANTLRVFYHLGYEVESIVSAYTLADRYQLGLNIALPAGWASQVWYAESFDKTAYNTRGTVNKAAISAALGWTIPVTPASGSTPAIASWAKPASVPYLNLFCDPMAFQCNSGATLAYITATRALDERYKINEKGIKADGPLFDLPGGPVKAAIGATYTTFAFSIVSLDNTGASSLVLPYQVNAERRAVWAVFTQVNIPLFSDQNALPLLRRVDLEFSWRHDQYSDVKGTSNPKVAFNWSPIDDFTIRGTWGNSFRAPSFGELSALANVAINGHNLIAQGLAVSPDPIVAGCTPGVNLPPVGSGAWKLMSSFGDGSPGSASACPVGPVTLPNGYVLTDPLRPHGINILGGVGAAAPVRAGGFNGGPNLIPELATNWGIGFDYTPSANFLTGLNLQATYYSIKLNGTLRNFGQPNSSSFNDPEWGDNSVFVPTDWLDSGLPGAAGCTSNLLPTTCQPFQEAVLGLLTHPRAQVSPQAQTLIMWIHDGGTVNRGWTKIDGIDFQASYDWEWGDLGAFNAGVLATYYLHTRIQSSPGGQVIDNLHQTVGTPGINLAEGVETNPRFRYRARLGWTNGPWSLTAFVDHQSHYYHLQTPPPNVNGNFCASNGGLDALGMGGTYTCAIQDYSNITPSWYSFDLSLGYDTMDMPANEYLRNISVQIVVQNVLDKHAPFQYKPSTAGGPPSAIAAFGGPGGGVSNAGRTISLILTKQW